jgi:carbamoyl-phosphate synthase large subunit
MQRFTEIKAWQFAHQLALDVYRVSAALPSDERFGITSQLRRAVVSVCANIAEGSKRDSNAEYCRFLNIAQASLAETECLMMLARDLALVDATRADTVLTKADEAARVLSGLRTKVSETLNSQR